MKTLKRIDMKEHKIFKPFDKVLVKQCDDAVWGCKFYSHWIGDLHEHITTDGMDVADEDILPYEGNEHLVGTTTNEPEEEVTLEEGEYLFVINDIVETPTWWNLIHLDFVNRYAFFDVEGGKWYYAIRFSDFNPNDMEETKKHILCVKNGKVVKYVHI